MGLWGREENRPRNTVFRGKHPPNKLLKVLILLSRNLLSLRRLLGTVTTRFALIALVAWQYSFDSTLRKLFVHPKYG